MTEPVIIRAANGLTAKLYCADCLTVLPTLGKVDAVITDPPYGVGASTGTGKYGREKWDRDQPDWDACAPSLDVLESVIGCAPRAVVWGMNYFALRPTRKYLVWDKGAGFKGRDFAECELAWCSWDGNAQVLCRDPLARKDYDGKEHPTQKPVEVMRWCLEVVGAAPNQTILDPFMGSGTTGVAALRMGCSFVGIEIEPRYFAIAKRRIEAEAAQHKMF